MKNFNEILSELNDYEIEYLYENLIGLPYRAHAAKVAELKEMFKEAVTTKERLFKAARSIENACDDVWENEKNSQLR